MMYQFLKILILSFIPNYYRIEAYAIVCTFTAILLKSKMIEAAQMIKFLV